MTELRPLFAGPGSIAWPRTPWLMELRGELMDDLEVEVYNTLRVAVLVAAKTPRAEIVRQLGITDVEARMAVQRITGVASRWSGA